MHHKRNGVLLNLKTSISKWELSQWIFQSTYGKICCQSEIKESVSISKGKDFPISKGSFSYDKQNYLESKERSNTAATAKYPKLSHKQFIPQNIAPRKFAAN